MKAWIIDVVTEKRVYDTIVVIGTREDAESKAQSLIAQGAFEASVRERGVEYSIAIKP